MRIDCRTRSREGRMNMIEDFKRVAGMVSASGQVVIISMWMIGAGQGLDRSWFNAEVAVFLALLVMGAVVMLQRGKVSQALAGVQMAGNALLLGLLPYNLLLALYIFYTAMAVVVIGEIVVNEHERKRRLTQRLGLTAT
jgi:hypothetical protein